MRTKLKRLVALLLILGAGARSMAQNCVPTGLNHSTVTSACNQLCRDLTFQVPDLRSTSSYTVIPIPYAPYEYVTPGGTTDPTLYQDDAYSQIFSLPFPFCFFDQVYTKAVVSSNGLVTFDIDRKNFCPNPGGAAWQITNPIPFGGGTSCASNNYPKLSIMGNFMDLDPRPASSAPDKKIEWRVEGTAPCRRFVVSYYNVGVYQNFPCGPNNGLSTFQIVMTESSGVIDVHFENKNICTNTSMGGRAILGLQGDIQSIPSQVLAAPGKNASVWGAFKESYRFVPTGGASRFVGAQLLRLDHTPIANATATNTTPGLLDLTFPNICTPAPSTDYVLKTSFVSCSDPGTFLEAYDTITVLRNPDLGATATTTSTNCGAPSGTIAVTTPPGVGTAPFTYVLDPGPGQVTQTANSPFTFTNVAMGTHTVVVTDASGDCNNTITGLVVDRVNNLAATLTATATACPAATNGSILVTPTTGQGPYSFVLDGTTTQNGAANTTFINVPAGLHSVVVTDASGCTTSPLSVTVDAGPPLSTGATATDVLCNGTATGIITITPLTVGLPPYEYSLDNINWQTSNVFTGQSAGLHFYYYREAGGCNGSGQVTINEPPALVMNTSSTQVICHGESNGTITLTPTGGTAPFQYSLDLVNWQSSNTFLVPAGTYTPGIRDANGCIKSSTAIVGEPPVLSASATSANASCNGGDDGTITVSAGGGNGGYTYSIDGTNFQSSNIFHVAPGTYTITVKDSKSCSQTTGVTVAMTNDLTFTPQTDPTICEGKSVQLSLVSNGITYQWTPSTALSNNTIYNPVANPTVTTQYVVTTTLGRCTANDTVIVYVNAAPIPDAGANGFICYGQTYTLQGSGGTQYSWSPPDYLSDAHIANPVSSAPRDMTYTLSITSDINGCASLTTDAMDLDVTAPIKITTTPFDTVVYSTDQFQFLAKPTDPDVINFIWSPTIGLDDPTLPNPLFTAGQIGDDMLYRVTGSTAAGCKGEGFIHVKVYKGPDIYVPTGFTPNGDGKNDRFVPFPVGIKSLTYLRVYSRWGQLVYSTSRLHEGWDGTINGEKQPTGTYVWIIQAVTDAGKIITKKGTVTLIR